MSDLSLQIKAADAEALFRRLAAEKQVRAAIREMVEFGVSEAQQAFRESRDPYGTPWMPLSEATLLSRMRRASRGGIRRKSSAGGGTKAKAMRALTTAKPVLDTGRLRNSITGVARTEYGVISASTEYAGVHQFGTSRAGRSRRVKIPARPFFPTEERGLPGNWQREFESILNAAVQRLVANG